MERSKAGTKEKRIPDGLNYSNQNTVIINIICLYFVRDGKSTMKFNYQKTNGLKQSKKDKSSTLPCNSNNT